MAKKAKKQTKFIYRFHDAITGRFVTKAYAKANPSTTVKRRGLNPNYRAA